MGHPFSEHRQTKKEHSRVGHITKGYAKGGAVHKDEAQDKKLFKKMMSKEMHADGEKPKHRMDRPNRAKGGRVKHGNAKTIVNVISGGHPAGGAIPPMPAGIAGAGMPPPGAMPPPMAAKPPMMPPPGAGPGMPPPGGPPPMPMRAKGGRVQKPAGSGVSPDSGTSKKTGGSPVFNASTRNGTQVSHDTGKDDIKDMDRGRVVTFKAGGVVKSFRARGGRVESPDGVAKATELPGGGGGGEARLAKAHRAARK